MELLAARGIMKYFSETGTKANDGIGFSLAEGETRAVIGENGAGKSTLARVVAGLVRPDSGSIRVRGTELRLGSVAAAEAAGIGLVPQVSLLAPDLTVAENLVLGREPRSLGLFLSRRKAYVEAALLIERYGFRLDPEARVGELPAALRRQAEIARALARGGEILILDEPSSILSESETDGLFALMARLADAGKAVLLITHRKSEVLKVADTITVLREGRVAAEGPVSDFDEARLSGLMARPGRPIGESEARSKVDAPIAWVEREGRAEAPALELRGVVLARGQSPISFSLRAGEILGVAALAGNGLGCLEDLASGMARPTRGEVLVRGRDIRTIPRDELRSRELSYVPSDRESRGLCLQAALRDSVLALRRGEFGAWAWVARGKRDREVRAMLLPLGLRSDPGALVSSLSGGTRQRMVLARELYGGKPLLVLAEPLQGLDLASQGEVSRTIRVLAARGSAVLLISSRVEEIAGLADRAIAIYRGEIAYEGQNEGEETGRKLLAAMTGGSGPAA